MRSNSYDNNLKICNVRYKYGQIDALTFFDANIKRTINDVNIDHGILILQ